MIDVSLEAATKEGFAVFEERRKAAEEEGFLLINDDWGAYAKEGFKRLFERKLQNGEELSDKDKLTAKEYGISLSELKIEKDQ